MLQPLFLPVKTFLKSEFYWKQVTGLGFAG
jgi:hypothetical protein